MAENKKMHFYTGTYTNMRWAKGKQGKGIYLIGFDPEDGSMDLISCSESPDNPSYMTFDTKFEFLHTINEIPPADGNTFGTVTSFKINRENGALTRLATVSSNGLSPCYIALDKSGKYAFVSNYSSGSAVLLTVGAGGAVEGVIQTVTHQGAGPDKRRQNHAYAHSVLLDKNQKFLFVADLGIDSVMVYSLAEIDGRIRMAYAGRGDVDPGNGPRHMALSASGRVLYVLCEMGSRVFVFDYDGRGVLTRKQDISAIPQGDCAEGNNSADMHISNDGRFLYASNRGHDSIAVFKILPDGTLEYIYAQPVFGKTPRNFALDPSGRYLVAANQDTDNIVSFTIDLNDGKLSKAGEINIPSPVCVKFTDF
jgi:6-phosphogluconolactonase